MPDATATIDQLIVNSPYEEPREHWRYHRETRPSVPLSLLPPGQEYNRNPRETRSVKLH